MKHKNTGTSWEKLSDKNTACDNCKTNKAIWALFFKKISIIIPFHLCDTCKTKLLMNMDGLFYYENKE